MAPRPAQDLRRAAQPKRSWGMVASRTAAAIKTSPSHWSHPKVVCPVGAIRSMATDPSNCPPMDSSPKTSTPTRRTAHAASAMNVTPIGPPR